MNKAELYETIACTTGIPKKDVTTVIDCLMDTVIDSLKKNEKIQIYGFGYFENIQQKERIGKNPQTGEEKVIPAKKNPKFRFSSRVKNLLNE